MIRGARPARDWRIERNDRQTVLQLSGDWIAEKTGIPSTADAERILNAVQASPLRVDLSNVHRWDSGLVAFLKMLREHADDRQPPIAIDETTVPEPARRLLALARADEAALIPPPSRRLSVAASVGQGFFRAWTNVVAAAALVGATALAILAAPLGRTHTRAGDVVQALRDAGAGAVGIVAIVNGLVGAILAFVGAVQLARFGAGIYVADLVGIAVVREMASIVTAIVMAGRTGGAYAAHLATMQGNEEIDALDALGIPVTEFLILPRIAALVTMMPLLYLYGCAFGLLGGFLVSIATLDLTTTAFLHQLRDAVSGRQFAIGLTKSLAFGAFVALTSCQIGLRAGRSAADVGRAATSAVVIGIIGVIALDAIFALCTNVIGI